MLLSLVLHLTAQTDGALSAEPGRVAQSQFLHWVEERDAALASALHDGSAARPYTASALCPEGRTDARTSEVRAGGRYWLRYTTLTEPLSNVLLQVAEKLPGSALELGGQAFTVQDVASDARDHPWAGRSSHNELAQAHFLSVHNPPRRFAFTFASPTAFHHTAGGTASLPTADCQLPTSPPRQLTVPLPLPELVFGSLLARWNAFAPLALPDELRRYAQECLAVGRYRLQTQALKFGQATSVGFTGECQYTALVWDAYWLRAVWLLTAYAFYSGVGVRTAVGMGQVHPQISPITQIDRSRISQSV